MRHFYAVILTLFISFTVVQPSHAAKHQKNEQVGVVLAMFGTTVEPALQNLLNIQQAVKKAFPKTEVRLAFTSNIIRGIWRKRSVDADYLRKHKEIPEEILSIQGPLAAIANMQDQGITTIIVQPTHLAPAEEYLDLVSYVNALASIKTIKSKFNPFTKLVAGRPAFGTFGTTHPYADDIRQAAKALAADAALAKKENAALVYMGHGNDHFPSSGPYLEFAARMRETYPDVLTLIGTVEGYPNLNDLINKLKKHNVTKVILKPLMVVAGDHAKNDMAGADDDSWSSILKKEGFKVKTVIKGLGESPDFVQLYVSRVAETAADSNIKLK